MFSLLGIWCSLVAAALAHNLPSGNSTSVAPQSASSNTPSSSSFSATSSAARAVPSTHAPSSSSAASSSSTVPLSASSVIMSTFSPTPTHFKGKNPKRGLAFADGDTPADLINANQSQSVISWQYNWASLPPAYLATSTSLNWEKTRNPL